MLALLEFLSMSCLNLLFVHYIICSFLFVGLYLFLLYNTIVNFVPFLFFSPPFMHSFLFVSYLRIHIVRQFYLLLDPFLQTIFCASLRCLYLKTISCALECNHHLRKIEKKGRYQNKYVSQLNMSSVSQLRRIFVYCIRNTILLTCLKYKCKRNFKKKWLVCLYFIRFEKVLFLHLYTYTIYLCYMCNFIHDCVLYFFNEEHRYILIHLASFFFYFCLNEKVVSVIPVRD